MGEEARFGFKCRRCCNLSGLLGFILDYILGCTFGPESARTLMRSNMASSLSLAEPLSAAGCLRSFVMIQLMSGEKV